MSGLAAADNRFPIPLWMLAAAMVVLFTARGMTIPFLVIFFGQVRGFGEGVAGAGIAINAVAGVTFTLLVAGWIDRFGARPVLILTMAGVGVMTFALPFVSSIPVFFLVMGLHGLASQLFWPASDGLATSLIDLRQAGRMFALLRVTNALGIGMGGLLGGLLVAGGGLDQYRLMFVLSAAGCILAALMVLMLVHTTRKAPEPDSMFQNLAEPSGWRAVLSDRRFLFSQVIIFLLVAGFVQLQVGMPPYLRAEAGISEAFIGSLFAIKTVILVIFQMPLASRISGWGPGVTMSLAALCWIAAYVLIGFSPWLVMLPFIAIVIFVVGEMLFMPTSGVVVVELAPERLRGRYLAMTSVAWGTAWGASSLVAGVILGSSYPFMVWPVIISLLFIGAVGGWLYDRAPSTRRGDPVSAPAEAAR
jgi:MFS family permease